jgi:hypothetical protein
MRMMWNQVMSITILATINVGVVKCEQQTTVTIPVKELIEAIRNHDVTWDGTPGGLVVHWGGATFLVAKYCGPDSSDQLVSALGDPDRFVAAHVLLAGRLLRKISHNAGSYDHLDVVLRADGSTSIDAAQRSRLTKMWTERLRRRPDGSRDPSLR